MVKKTGLLIFTLCLLFQLQAQIPVPKYPNGYFRWPTNLATEIVANMGELRPNHWHMGLDVRTNQVVNQLVYAAADGYVAYAGIRPLSFGRFLIINHPNGLSTLYAHLNDFNPEIEAWVTAQQYKQQSWASELKIPSNLFPVKKGTFIAYSGTTGGSQGPHVHFEIMDTKSEKRLNPMLFGMPLTDNTPPVMSRIALYNRSKSVYEQSPLFFALKNTDSGYILPKIPVLKTGFRKNSFAIQCFDRINGSSNQDGIYAATLYADNTPVVRFVIDSIGYEETRYMNAQIDYKYRSAGGTFIQHLSKMPGDNSGVYHPLSGNGVLTLTDTLQHPIRIELRDAYGNTSVLNFLLQYDEAMAANVIPATPQQQFLPAEVNVLERPDFELYMPEGCLYDAVNVRYFRSNSLAGVTALHQLNDQSVPIQEPFTVRLKPDKIIPDNARDRVVIRRSGKTGSVEKAVWQGGWLMARFRDFGSFQAFTDLQPPTVNELGKGDTVNLSAASRIVFTPADNFGVAGFRAELNGEWLRFTNDKGRSWIYNFDERVPYGVYNLKVTVTDIAGNTTVKEWWFKRSEYTPPPPRKKATKKTSSKKASAKKPPVKKTTKKKK